MSIQPKVYYDNGVQAIVGPLGFWRKGGTFALGDRTFHVATVDLDGGAVAWEAGYLAALCVREPQRGETAAEVLESLRGVHTGKPVEELTPAQVEQCKAIAAVGQRQRAEHDAAEAVAA